MIGMRLLHATNAKKPENRLPSSGFFIDAMPVILVEVDVVFVCNGTDHATGNTAHGGSRPRVTSGNGRTQSAGTGTDTSAAQGTLTFGISARGKKQ